MDLDKIEEVGLDPLKEMLSKMGGWPVLEGAGGQRAGRQEAGMLGIHRREVLPPRGLKGSGCRPKTLTWC